jgi:hypothetical protein
MIRFTGMIWRIIRPTRGIGSFSDGVRIFIMKGENGEEGEGSYKERKWYFLYYPPSQPELS